MADQSYRPNDENEYQYQEEQQEGSDNYKFSDELPPMKKRFNFKPIIVIIVVLLIGFGVYKLISHKSQAPAQPDLATQIATRSTKATTAVNSPAVAQGGVVPAPAASQEEDEIQKLQTMQQQMQDMLSSQEKQQFQTQTSVMSVQASVDQVNQQLQSINQSLAVLNRDYQQRQEQARQAVIAKQRAAQWLRKSKQYFVAAVIPGRAWLKAADGSMVTVAVGDKLPGYGQVLSINPYSGIVVTEKGSLPYGSN